VGFRGGGVRYLEPGVGEEVEDHRGVEGDGPGEGGVPVGLLCKPRRGRVRARGQGITSPPPTGAFLVARFSNLGFCGTQNGIFGSHARDEKNSNPPPLRKEPLLLHVKPLSTPIGSSARTENEQKQAKFVI